MACLCKKMFGDKMDVSSTCIGNWWVFENLSQEERHALTEAALRKVYNQSDIIFSQGDEAQTMFLVKAGLVKLSKFTKDGNEVILDFRKSGDFLGESIFQENIKYPATATCMQETLTCGFTKHIFEALVLKYPNVGLQVIKNLSQHMSVLSSHVESISLANITQKLYSSLLTMAGEYGKKNKQGFIIDLPLTHEELSFLVGAHRVSITRAMKELRKSGRIIQAGKKIIITSSGQMEEGSFLPSSRG